MVPAPVIYPTPGIQVLWGLSPEGSSSTSGAWLLVEPSPLCRFCCGVTWTRRSLCPHTAWAPPPLGSQVVSSRSAPGGPSGSRLSGPCAGLGSQLCLGPGGRWALGRGTPYSEVQCCGLEPQVPTTSQPWGSIKGLLLSLRAPEDGRPKAVPCEEATRKP